MKDELINCMLKEIELQQNHLAEGSVIDTIYFGGGTPSLLSNSAIGSLLQQVYQFFNVAENVEITLESNPDDITPIALQQWLSMGINRLSVGMQSFDEEELKWMNRNHTALQSKKCITDIIDAGLSNFTIDVIFGSPYCTDEALMKTLQFLIDHRVPHLSCYALTVEEKTALHHFVAQNKSPDIDTEQQARQFLLISDWLAAAGYEHYEISNYALPTFRSRHNSNYWKGIPYCGIGPGAHAYDGNNKRRWNIANNAMYVNSIQQGWLPYEEETLSEAQQYNEYIMTSLRTTEGISLQYINETFGSHQLMKLVATCASFVSQGQLIIKKEFIQLTREGKLFADGIASSLFED